MSGLNSLQRMKLVVDNGGGELKAARVTDEIDYKEANLDVNPVVLPHCTAKSRAEKKFFVADGLDTAVDLASLYIRRPHERGYIVNWDVEQAGSELGRRVLTAFTAGCVAAHVPQGRASLLVTESLFTPNEMRDNLDEFVFEELGFNKYCCASSPLLALADHKVPFYEGRIVHKACRRIDVGGKVMTNLLKETLSSRQWNMMDETILVNAIKERLSFVSQDLERDLTRAKQRGRTNDIRRLYSLPTSNTPGVAGQDRLGHVIEGDEAAARSSASPMKRQKVEEGQGAASGKGAQRLEEECVLEVSNERFTIPEVLFTPRMIGLHQSGIPLAIQSSVRHFDPPMHPLMYSTVLLVGGNALIPGFHARMLAEVRSLAPSDLHVSVPQGPQPANLSAWRGGMRLVGAGALEGAWVTKQEYEEKGHQICRSRFKFASPSQLDLC
ncbi:hypothetical protein GUITHDRAFT_101311 [Guillardia theta CCMP2712]|uniref:Uncharacterized protein n=1 Tax=Guillardia theta (strain CCMP2712) TaxID=905079 RepID=L1JXP6_GUITC|nr:hypothetical protein GUITHDRAFT_101311 [Guillardia theta CCMP2712]EKX52858.1 hypothetical protein GUITHDRAFT_101311 [Guillardia theta CCMP2712]|eukprot:XP_005839838.1 hypothetical protein GUITHDRAFT_101311 [Guillardia theta CCMP2712]